MALRLAGNHFRNTLLDGKNNVEITMRKGFAQLFIKINSENKNDVILYTTRIVPCKRGLKLSAVNREKKNNYECIEETKEITGCHRKVPPKEKCEEFVKEPFKADCLKICLPCCRPVNVPVRCDDTKIHFSMCKIINFKYPSYAESVATVHDTFYKADCCRFDPCPIVMPVRTQGMAPKLKLLQKKKLGLSPESTRFFSTSIKNYVKISCTEVKKDDEVKKNGLPCLKKDPNIKVLPIKRGKDCKKICMPCCKPARDPPDCTFPYAKIKCKKYKAPRPAFSECQADKMKIIEPCECSLELLKRCDQTKSKKDKCEKEK